MKAVWIVLLAGAMALGASGLSDVRADEAPAAEPPEAKPPSNEQLAEGLQQMGEQSQKQAEEAKAEQEAKAEKEDKDAKPAEDAKPQEPQRDNTPYGRKLAEVEKLVATARQARERIPKLEARVNDKVAKLTDSAKNPVEVKKLQEELAQNRPSRAAKTYRDLMLALAREWEKVKASLARALQAAKALENIKTDDEDLKVEGEALAASTRQECIETLMKLAAMYQQVGDEDRVTNCYRQILGIDKLNAAARQYFKELAERKKNRPSGGSGGSSGSHYDGGSRGSRR